jgi:hypothetical protein
MGAICTTAENNVDSMTRYWAGLDLDTSYSAKST